MTFTLSSIKRVNLIRIRKVVKDSTDRDQMIFMEQILAKISLKTKDPNLSRVSISKITLELTLAKKTHLVGQLSMEVREHIDRAITMTNGARERGHSLLMPQRNTSSKNTMNGFIDRLNTVQIRNPILTHLSRIDIRFRLTMRGELKEKQSMESINLVPTLASKSKIENLLE